MEKYIITTAGGGWVGLFNYGRTYKAASTKRVIKCTATTAATLAQTFGGTATKVQ